MNQRTMSGMFTAGLRRAALAMVGAGIILLCAAGCAGRESTERKVIAYVYDSFVSEWGPGPELARLFTEKTGIEVSFVSAGDAGQILSRVIAEKGKPQADIVIGIDNNLLPRALDAGVLEPYRSPALAAVPAELVFDSGCSVLPYDYGCFAVIYDALRIPDPPSSLEDLAKPEFQKSLILMDPRTSSPGLGFLLWTRAVYGKDYLSYWERLKPSILTITEGWDSGYGLFTSGEAPMVLSYTTSPAYHLEYEGTDRYRAAVFSEGHYLQIEGAGLVKGAPHRKEARAFLDFLLSPEAQGVLPLTNWMFPVAGDIPLPASFSAAPIPERQLLLDPADVRDNLPAWIDEWVRIMAK